MNGDINNRHNRAKISPGWEAFQAEHAWADLLRGWRMLLLLLLLVLAHAIGWQVTRVDPVSLVTGMPNMYHIVDGLTHPDLFVPQVAWQKAAARLLVSGWLPAGETPPSSLPSGPIITLSATSVQAGEPLTVNGAGFNPHLVGNLYLTQVGETLLGPFSTDMEGKFSAVITLPASLQPGEYWVEARAGIPQTWPGGLPAYEPSETLRLSTELMIQTIFLALMGTSFAVVISLPLSFLGARNLMGHRLAGQAVYLVTRTFFNVLRSIEVMIVVVIMAVVVGIGPFAGVLALAVHGIGSLGKLYSEAIESIDPGPVEAIRATGATWLQTVIYAVIPQVMPHFIAYTLYRWDINIRSATVIGLVGGGGIGYLLIQYINLLQWHQAGTAIWLIAIVVMIMDYASGVIRERIV